MVRAPDWDTGEFRTLLDSPSLSDEELSRLLRGRSSQAVRVVREGIHQFHESGHSSLLSQLMVDELKLPDRGRKCPKCGHPVM